MRQYGITAEPANELGELPNKFLLGRFARRIELSKEVTFILPLDTRG
jgi:hypothetical protein